MMKEFIVSFYLLFSLSGCDLFGWDSSGGLNPITSDGNIFLVEIPLGYPYSGDGEVFESLFGPAIAFSNIEFSSFTPLEDISDEDAFTIVQFVCDLSVVSLSSITQSSEELIISWVNETIDAESLSISDETFSDSSYREISCL